MYTDTISTVLDQFKIDTKDVNVSAISQGYINDTFVVHSPNNNYILQRINSDVFKQVEALQANIDLVVKKLIHPEYAKIDFLRTSYNNTLCELEGSYWRMMTYIENSKTYNTTSDQEVAFQAGKIIGLFHKLLENQSEDVYTDTIQNFHHLPSRLFQFDKALQSASDLLKVQAQQPIAFVKQHSAVFSEVYLADLPIRICHNDTKLNNILFRANKGLCLIDLDTIMRGYFLYDFGDAIRTIANPAAEDERDLSIITFKMPMVAAFMEGLNASQLKLTYEEKNCLSLGASLMPFLHGTRALTDYLNGNIYYKVAYPEQNLDRAKSLLHFSKLALDNRLKMQDLIFRTLK